MDKQQSIHFIVYSLWKEYNCDVLTMTLINPEVTYLENIVMWVYRRMLKVSWWGKVTNEEMVRRVHEGRKIIMTIRSKAR